MFLRNIFAAVEPLQFVNYDTFERQLQHNPSRLKNWRKCEYGLLIFNIQFNIMNVDYLTILVHNFHVRQFKI